jgi:hypothetical protein
MAFGTLLTLFVVPTAYTLLARRSEPTSVPSDKEILAEPHPHAGPAD